MTGKESWETGEIAIIRQFIGKPRVAFNALRFLSYERSQEEVCTMMLRHFMRGDRVATNQEAVEWGAIDRVGVMGTVVYTPRRDMVTVKWDGQRNTEVWHESFLRVIARPTAAAQHEAEGEGHGRA